MPNKIVRNPAAAPSSLEARYDSPAADAPEVDDTLLYELISALMDSDAVQCVWRLSAHAVALRDGLAMIVLNAHLLVPLDDWSSEEDRKVISDEVSEWQARHHYPAMDFDEAVECILPPATRRHRRGPRHRHR